MNIESKDYKSLFNEFYSEAKELFPKYKTHAELFPRMILLNFNEFDLETNDIEELLDGLGSNDFGIDTFLKDKDNNFHIFQFKSKMHFKENNNQLIIKNMHSEIDSFVHTIEKLKNDATVKNDRLIDLKEEIVLNPNSQFFFHYYIQEYIEEDKIEEYQNTYKNKNLEIYDLVKITELYKEHLSKIEDNLQVLDFPIENSMSIDNTGKRFLITINGFEIYKLMKDKKFQLFKNNIRFFLGAKQSVNKEIIKTIKCEPDRFFSFNNGITIEATAQKIHKSGNYITLNNPSIINGAQTVNCIYNAYKDLSKNNKEESITIKYQKLEDNFKRIKLLAKIIIVDEVNSQYSKDLSRYVNSQNSIKEADYFSNLDEQLLLKKTLGSKYKLFYEIKRGELTYYRSNKRKTTKEDITGMNFIDFDKENYLKLEDFARNYIAVFTNPGSNNHSVNNLFKKNNNLYETVIQPQLTNDFHNTIKEMLFSYYLVKCIKEELVNYKAFYQAIHSNKLFLEDKNNLLSALGLPNKEILQVNLNKIEDYEEDYGSLNISLMSKGKYVYSYLVRFFLQNLLLLKTTNENKLQDFLSSDYLMDYNKFKSIIIPLFYKLNEFIFEPFFNNLISNGKTENSICMTVFSLEDLEKKLLDRVKEIKKAKQVDLFFKF